MKLGPKYKIARRLGAPIFEKTQTQKFALSLARKEKQRGKRPRRRNQSEFATQLLEKQKARFSYGVTEKQFRNYVLKALANPDPVQKLYALLETRLDNTLYRAGLTKTRAQARQAASHGHTLVNGRKATIPSMAIKVGDKISIRAGVATSPLYAEAGERMKEAAVPAWLGLDTEKREVEVNGVPAYAPSESLFDLGAVIEFYNR